jgi:predicted nucleic acid-binding protein
MAIDCSVVIKWQLVSEPHAKESEELFLDWQHLAVELSAPILLPIEVMSAFLRSYRQGRILETEAHDYIRDLSALPFVLHGTTTPLALRAFEIARHHNQRSYDCVYVALAEQESIELWTGDQRLYNALHGHYPFVRWIADYVRKRP